MGRFRSVGHRILFVVGVFLLVGFGAVAALYIDRQEKFILAQNEVDLVRVTQSAVNGLQSIMLKSYGGIAHGYSDSLRKLPDVVDYRILRKNGVEAFADIETVATVNAKLGGYEFKERRFAAPPEQVLAADHPVLREVLATQRPRIFYAKRADGGRSATVLDPVLHGEGCVRCHDDEGEVRGVVLLTVSMDSIESDLRATLRNALLFIAATMLVTIYLINRFARRTVVEPIRSVSDAFSVAAGGDLSVSLAVERDDEIGQMASSFNEMSLRLNTLYSGLRDEENKLTTIIQSAHEGIVVTDPQQRIVLVNPAACELLGCPAEKIVANGFRYLLGNPALIDRQLASAGEAPIAYVDYLQRKLAVQASTIRNGDGVVIGSAALLRDVTEEKRAEDELRRLAETDGLTGLYNRRYFDERLSEEFMRWKRYKGAFSVALFDVDHFKKFNDNHGHECGDRVLQAISGLLRGAADPVAMVCRYGGEELVLILPDFDEAKAAQIVDLLREMIADILVDDLHVTVSVGVAGCPTNAPASAEELLKLADQALYVAKQNGRNQVCRASQALAVGG